MRERKARAACLPAPPPSRTLAVDAGQRSVRQHGKRRVPDEPDEPVDPLGSLPPCHWQLGGYVPNQYSVTRSAPAAFSS